MLRRWQAIKRLDVERTEAEVGHHLGDVEIEKGGTCFRHEAGFQYRQELRIIVHCTMSGISAMRQTASRAFLQRTRTIQAGSGSPFRAASAARRPTIARSAAAAHRAPPSCGARSGEVVALPNSHRRKVSGRGQLDRDHAANSAGRDFRGFEHPPHRAQQRGAGAQRGQGSRGKSRRSTSSAALCVEARQIAASADRTTGRAGVRPARQPAALLITISSTRR